VAAGTLPVKGRVPREGFEPSVEDPKSPALPLGYRGARLQQYRGRRRPPIGAVTCGGRESLAHLMRFLTVSAAALASCVLLGACAGYRFPGGPAPGTGTVSRQVTVAPCAPVQKADVPCQAK